MAAASAGSLARVAMVMPDTGLRAVVGETYPMSDARRAHEDLQSRKTSGKLLLDPSA